MKTLKEPFWFLLSLSGWTVRVLRDCAKGSSSNLQCASSLALHHIKGLLTFPLNSQSEMSHSGVCSWSYPSQSTKDRWTTLNGCVTPSTTVKPKLKPFNDVMVNIFLSMWLYTCFKICLSKVRLGPFSLKQH